ncbi:non-canonical purine NTP pyrophosphatase [Candidatus Peregrinibacteria bacterium]|nr:non-canonical purine NTP pyrophosphatase [Candidatus Peregrinibacteria bacterium]
MQEFLIATKNPGKYREIVEVLGELPFEFKFLGDIDIDIDDSDFCEDGETFAENAYKKAEYYHGKTGLLTLGEDSGILVDALKGELGVKTRRWGAGEKAGDDEWIEYFLKRMEGENQRSASFFCHACLFGRGVRADFSGETRGEISKSLMAPIVKGIPISSCFIPEGATKVYASLTIEEKNRISHRGKAMNSLRDFLANQ